MDQSLPKHILVIDDEEINSFIVRKLVEKLSPGIKFSSCNSGIAGLVLLKELNRDNLPLPEIIMVDINMRLMDGWQFLDEYQRLFGECSQTSIVMLTSSIFRQDVERSKNHPVKNTFVTKPLTSEVLIKLVSK